MAFILGKKRTMRQLFTDSGKRVPVTDVATSPTYLVGLKFTDIGECRAVKLGFGVAKHIAKPVSGELKKAGIDAPLRFLKEIRITPGSLAVVEKDGKKGIKVGETEVFIGQELTPELLFKKGDIVSVTGTSKSKGFQGVVRRHKFAGGPKTHGQSDRERAPGSIGASTTPGRVMKGKRMAGRMGGVTTTVKNLHIVDVSNANLLIEGLVPGPSQGFIIIKTM